MKTLLCVFAVYTVMGIYFEYQNNKENKDEHKRPSS